MESGKKIGDFIPFENIILDLSVLSKSECLHALANQTAKTLGLDSQVLFDALMAREALGSTGLGDGVAIPHARLSEIQEPFGIFAKLNRPLNFDAIDERPVDLVVLLLFPEAPSGDQLNLLACTARCLRNRAFADRLRQQADERAFYEQLRS